MEAGRELDRLVAEKIFGRDPMNARHGLHKDGDIEYHWGYPLGHDVAPYYSTNIAAAWEVVEKLYADGYWAELQTPWNEPGGEANQGHSCGFTPFLTTGWNGVPDHWTPAPTMPLAICLAALKAKGIDIDPPDDSTF